MATPSRPSRLLNLNKSPVPQKRITALNATNSPLLRLSPEIRARIYNIVLGGKVIRICEASKVALCVNHEHFLAEVEHSMPATQDSTTGVARQCTKCHPRDHPLPLDSYFGCLLETDQQSLPLNMLQVCHQIYHDAVLIPFTNNLFAEESLDGSNFRPFLNKLVPTQLKAIRRLYIKIRDSLLIHSVTQLNRMQGLEVLQYEVVSFCPHDDPVENLEDGFQRAKLGKHKLPQLRHAHINVRFIASANDPQRVYSEEKFNQILQWVKSAEDRMLK